MAYSVQELGLLCLKKMYPVLQVRDMPLTDRGRRFARRYDLTVGIDPQVCGLAIVRSGNIRNRRTGSRVRRVDQIIIGKLYRIRLLQDEMVR